MTSTMRGLIQLSFLIEHIYLIGGWLGENKKTSIPKTRVSKRLIEVFEFYQLLRNEQ